MPNTKPHIYSRISKEAVILLGETILLYRKQRHMTAQDLANRAGISRTTLYKIEHGDLKCEIGLVFEVASIVGVKLFENEHTTIESLRERIDDKIALLPKRIHPPKKKFDNEF